MYRVTEMPHKSKIYLWYIYILVKQQFSQRTLYVLRQTQCCEIIFFSRPNTSNKAQLKKYPAILSKILFSVKSHALKFLVAGILGIDGRKLITCHFGL